MKLHHQFHHPIYIVVQIHQAFGAGKGDFFPYIEFMLLKFHLLL